MDYCSFQRSVCEINQPKYQPTFTNQIALKSDESHDENSEAVRKGFLNYNFSEVFESRKTHIGKKGQNPSQRNLIKDSTSTKVYISTSY